MKRPIFVRPLSDAERETLEAGLRSSDAFTLRRCQILIASARGENAYQIAHELGCNPQTARNAIHTFNEKGLPQALRQGSKRPHTVHRAFQGPEQTRGFAGAFAPQTQEVRQTHECVDAGSRRRGELRRGPHEGADNWRDRPGYFGAIGSALGAGQALDHFPRSGVPKKKRRRDRLIGLSEGRSEWVVGFLDETWWSRLARPALNSWSDAGEPLRLIEQSVAKDDPDPKAISCYGLYVPEFEKVWVRFVDGRPVSSITTRFLSWCCQKLRAAGKKVWVLIWDNASWHISKEVREWIASHNRKAKNRGQGVRIISCLLPKKSPWLNSMEPKWVHGKRKVVEPDGLLTAHELAERVCLVFDCAHYEHLSIAENAA